jgi:hypothetical protein
MKTRSHLLTLWLLAFATVTGVGVESTPLKPDPSKPSTTENQVVGSIEQSPLAAVQTGDSAARTDESVLSDATEIFNQWCSSGDAKLTKINEKLQEISALDGRLGTIRLLLVLVLGLTSFTLIIIAFSVFSRLKSRGHSRSSNEVLLQEIKDLKKRINTLMSEVKLLGRESYADHQAEKSRAVTTSLDEENQPASYSEAPPSPLPASVYEERPLTSSAPFYKKESAALPDPEPRFSEPPAVRDSFIDDPSSRVRAQDMGENFRLAILQNGGKFQAGWETFKSTQPREIESDDVWYDLAANEKVLTFQCARMGNAVHCRVVIIGPQEHGRRGLLFISHIGEFYPRIEDFPFCDVRADGPVQRDRLLSYVPPVVACRTGRSEWEVVHKGEIEYN